MNLKLFLAGAVVLGGGLLLAARPPQDPPAGGDPMAMFGGAGKYLKPNENHEWLGQMVGQWDVTMKLFMGPGMPPMESKGTSTGRWLMDGRWLTLESEIPMFGMPVKTVWTLGYDNFKQKYVGSNVNSFETAMRSAEGFRDQAGTSLHLYGTLDEYLTGEHDKMVRYTWKILSPDERTVEVHDLAIGLENTKVIEIHYKRKP